MRLALAAEDFKPLSGEGRLFNEHVDLDLDLDLLQVLRGLVQS